MGKIKCITFDKEAQNNLPQHIKDKMKLDRDKALKEASSLPQQKCPRCGNWCSGRSCHDCQKYW